MILSVLAADYVFGQVCINSDYNTKKVGFWTFKLYKRNLYPFEMTFLKPEISLVYF